MRKRAAILICALVSAGIVASLVVIFRPFDNGPRYRGMTVAYWSWAVRDAARGKPAFAYRIQKLLRLSDKAGRPAVLSGDLAAIPVLVKLSEDSDSTVSGQAQTALLLHHLHRAETYMQQRDYAKAIDDYDAAIRFLTSSDLPVYVAQVYDASARNNIAWLRATCPIAEVRDGKQALQHARKACRLTGWMNPLYLDTLAAAHAELGEFDEAVEWQTSAIAKSQGTQELGDDAKKRLDLYKQRKPYRTE